MFVRTIHAVLAVIAIRMRDGCELSSRLIRRVAEERAPIMGATVVRTFNLSFDQSQAALNDATLNGLVVWVLRTRVWKLVLSLCPRLLALAAITAHLTVHYAGMVWHQASPKSGGARRVVEHLPVFSEPVRK